MTREEVREKLAEAGITVANVTTDEIKALRLMIGKHLRSSGIIRGSARIARARADMRFIEMRGFYFDRREAVSFNPDGFIGIAGWADNDNVQPILSALLEWSSTRSAA
ncbi:hypothetical protein [Vreelandella venusta]|uniref:hypothetical protein n=1 Tax=Vreelandella venusta TaxID=44935 RepID=UPI003AA81F7E